VIAIRPEDLHPVASDGAAVPTTVSASEFKGREFVGFGRTADGVELSFRAPNRLEPGAAVHLGADPERALVFAGGQA